MKNKLLAWFVHIYTAIGGVFGVFAMIYAAQGEISTSFILLIISLVFDTTDGVMARKFHVREILPDIDGVEMDNVIDILTYAWVPILIIYQIDVLPHPALLVIPTLASLYYYAQANPKSEDNFFLGFPVYWNVVALYLYLFMPGELVSTIILIIPAILSFIPTRYLYPSKNKYLWKTSWLLCGIWFSMVSYILFANTTSTAIIIASLFFPVYYILLSFWCEYKARISQV